MNKNYHLRRPTEVKLATRPQNRQGMSGEDATHGQKQVSAAQPTEYTQNISLLCTLFSNYKLNALAGLLT